MLQILTRHISLPDPVDSQTIAFEDAPEIPSRPKNVLRGFDIEEHQAVKKVE